MTVKKGTKGRKGAKRGGADEVPKQGEPVKEVKQEEVKQEEEVAAEPVANESTTEPDADKPTEPTTGTTGGMKSDKNSYTVYRSSTGFKGGRYISTNPLSAAKKAASRAFKASRANSLTIVLKQTTSGSNKKYYKYEATRKSLKKPIVVNLNGNQVEYKHKVEVKAVELDKDLVAKMEEKKAAKKSTAKKSTKSAYKSRGGCCGRLDL